MIHHVEYVAHTQGQDSIFWVHVKATQLWVKQKISDIRWHKRFRYFVRELLPISLDKVKLFWVWWNTYVRSKWPLPLLLFSGCANPQAVRHFIGLLQRVIRFAPWPLLVFNYPRTLSFSSWWRWRQPIANRWKRRLHQDLIGSFASACQAQMEHFITVTARFIFGWWGLSWEGKLDVSWGLGQKQNDY